MNCIHCNEHMEGNGYTTPIQCPNIPEDKLVELDYVEPDSGPYYCNQTKVSLTTRAKLIAESKEATCNFEDGKS
jgi:hypothetical protein